MRTRSPLLTFVIALGLLMSSLTAFAQSVSDEKHQLAAV
jgi:hypothetical protein